MEISTEVRGWAGKVDWLRCIHEATVACFGPEHALFSPGVIADQEERTRLGEKILQALLQLHGGSENPIEHEGGSNQALYLEYLLAFIRTCLIDKPYQQIFLLSCDIEATLTYVCFDLTEAGDELADEFHRLNDHVAPAIEQVSVPQTQEEWRRFVRSEEKALRMPKLLTAILASRAEPDNALLSDLIAYDPNKPGTAVSRRSA